MTRVSIAATTITGTTIQTAEPDDGRLSVQRLTITGGPQGHPRVLVRDVSFHVESGQTLGIVGESGSGKSLTARALAGLLPKGLHASGSVSYGGLEIIGRRERDLRSTRGTRISLLLQDPFTILNPLLTVGAHLVESMRVDGHRSRSDAGADIGRRLGEVGLKADVAERYPFQLSGGMRQRVALACALARDPSLLIADEPTTALDVTTQAEVLRLLAKIQRDRGMSLILITHDLRVAFEVCDRIQVMYAGSVVEQAPAQQLAALPAHPYSLGLLLTEPPVDRYVEKLAAIPGAVPRAEQVGDQCGFADRCEWKQSPCVAGRPPLATINASHRSACLRIDHIRGELTERLSGRNTTSTSPRPITEGSAPIAVVTDVRKSFRSSRLFGRNREAVALDGVNFTVGQGESVGLVGETGSGKTTIARLITGLTRPDSGTVEINDVDQSDGSRRRTRQLHRLVQMVFQDPYASLNPALTVGATLREALAVRGKIDDPSERVPALLAEVGLPASYAGIRPVALSGGERQRIAIARAIAVQPRLLICDEPVAALDVSAQAHVLELLRTIRRHAGISMLFITHDLAVVRQMTERVVVLHRGRIVEAGLTAEVLDDPQHEYTRRLVAAIPGSEAWNPRAE
ncbi:dipeptide ABC transporter ATP-binding protein [Amycolatopsis pithecellobii]|uniref:Dipeptide ABC transporter ATP-binding protein n=1 Tax=Amycolatopsis pithecellobii TaxID=664692 RepID=A0A6N7Z377_9PSEU|nr:ABC transporter ATP-binding protein [Amycolatopsis pithecellobii]MTD54641.1 dipeptide ABC transporter ATP-binding protein [Amycolatopsis pithecellobii]